MEKWKKDLEKVSESPGISKAVKSTKVVEVWERCFHCPKMQAKVHYHSVFNSYLFLFLAQYRLAHTVKSPLTATSTQPPPFLGTVHTFICLTL